MTYPDSRHTRFETAILGPRWERLLSLYSTLFAQTQMDAARLRLDLRDGDPHDATAWRELFTLAGVAIELKLLLDEESQAWHRRERVEYTGQDDGELRLWLVM